jgi:predicted RNase H-like HicB family nuclease
MTMQHQPATYDAYMEIAPDGSALAQLLDLPGCFGRGRSEQEALAALTAAIPGYYAWLQRHDDYTPIVAGPHAVAVRERTVTPPGAFFSPDAEPVEPGDLEIETALLEWAYADVLAFASATADGMFPAALDPLLRGQLWLISRLEVAPRPAALESLPGGPRERLQIIGKASVARLRAATEDERGRILEHEGERWSLRKVLRRSITLVRMQTEVLAHSAR